MVKCDKCCRPVKETMHTIAGYKADWYGTLVTKDGGMVIESIVCEECYEFSGI